MTMDYGAILDAVFSGGGAKKEPKIIYQGRLAYLEQPDGSRERSPANDLPPEESTALTPAQDQAPRTFSSGGQVTGINPNTGEVVYQTPLPTSGGSTTINIPSQAASGIPLSQVQSIAPNVQADDAGVLRIAGRNDYYKPIGLDRNGQPIYDYVAAPAASAASGTTRRPTPLEISAQAIGNANRLIQGAPQGNELGASAPATTPEPAPVGAPPRGSQIIRDFYGTPTTARIDSGAGGIQDIPLNSSNLRSDFAMFGLSPTGNPERDAQTALASRAWIGDERARNRSVEEISNQLDLYRGRNLARQGRITAGGLGALVEPESMPTDFSLPAQEPSLSYYGPEDEEIPMFAEGGSIQVGANPQSWYDSARNTMKTRPDTARTRRLTKGFDYLNDMGYEVNDFGENYTGQLYNGVPPWMLPAWSRSGRGYGPGKSSFIRKLGDSPYPDQNSLSRLAPPPGEENNPGMGGGYSLSRAGGQGFSTAPRRVGYAPSYANGGRQVLDEPVVGMGMMSNEPKFVAGEAGPEMATFTPVGKPPQQRSAPYPRANKPVALLDPVRVLAAMKKGR